MTRVPAGEDSVGRVLIVDDDRINRTLLTRGVEQAGHLVRTAENGRDALALLARRAIRPRAARHRHA